MEVVLGIDNLIFIAVLSKRAPEGQERRARSIGIAMALISRLVLLCFIGVIISLKVTVISVGALQMSAKDIILFLGGAFLVYQATQEIWETLEGDHEHSDDGLVRKTLISVLVQMFVLNAVFSIDGVITAVGLTDIVMVMILGVVISTVVMLLAAEPLTNFIERHPTVQMLAFSFLLLIGGTLILESLHSLGIHVEKWAIYSIMAFAALVEFTQPCPRRRRHNVAALPKARRDVAGRVDHGADVLKNELVNSGFGGQDKPNETSTEEQWVTGLARGAEALAIARLLLELAHADGAFDDSERRQLLADLSREFHLSTDDATRLFDYAEVRFGDQVEFSGLILRLKRDCSVDERAEILRLLWKMAYADGQLHDFEFTLIRRMAALLYVEGPAMSKARRRALQELGFDPDTPAGQDPRPYLPRADERAYRLCCCGAYLLVKGGHNAVKRPFIQYRTDS